VTRTLGVGGRDIDLTARVNELLLDSDFGEMMLESLVSHVWNEYSEVFPLEIKDDELVVDAGVGNGIGIAGGGILAAVVAGESRFVKICLIETRMACSGESSSGGQKNERGLRSFSPEIRCPVRGIRLSSTEYSNFQTRRVTVFFPRHFSKPFTV